MRPGRAGPHRRPCSCRFLRQVLVARRMWQAMRPKLQQYQSVAAEFRSLSDELDDLPPVVVHSRTEPQASLVRSSSTKRGQACILSSKACAGLSADFQEIRSGACRPGRKPDGVGHEGAEVGHQVRVALVGCKPDQHRRVRDLLVRRCQRPSVVRGSGGAWSGVACAILIRCSESVALESTKKLLNITSA